VKLQQGGCEVAMPEKSKIDGSKQPKKMMKK
jgi:hypothetical protein